MTTTYHRPGHVHRRACHEAGHAVVALRVGYRITSAHVIRHGKSFGGELKCWHPDKTPKVHLWRLWRLYGGMAAEMLRYGPRIEGLTCVTDLTEVCKMTGREQLFQDDVMALMIHTMLLRTWNLLAKPVNWGGVEAMTAALVEHESLTGVKCHQLIKRAEPADPPRTDPPTEAMTAALWRRARPYILGK